MHRYFCFGLIIDSPIPLPELVRSTSLAPADVAIRFGPIHSSLPEAPDENTISANAHEARFFFQDVGSFVVRDGCDVVIERHANAIDSDLRLALLGRTLSLLLHQQRHLILHASGVVIGDAAVAFAADCGTGKSTLAAAFHAAGHRLIADDMVPVAFDARGNHIVAPGFPQLKLFAESAALLDRPKLTSVELSPGEPKRGWRVPDCLADRPLPLRRIYILTDSEDGESIRPLTPGQVVAALVANCFATEWLIQTQSQERYFRQITRIAAGVIPVKRLYRRRRLELLPDVVRMVERDLATDSMAVA